MFQENLYPVSVTLVKITFSSTVGDIIPMSAASDYRVNQLNEFLRIFQKNI